jgi:hypothetical protein
MAALAPDIGPYRRSAPFFGALLLLALPAFWSTYFFPRTYEADWHVHVHGFALFSWAVLLIVQPWLIASGRTRIHRRLGKASYVLAPVIVVSTVLLARYRIHASTPGFEQLYFLWIQAGLMVLFAVSYAQAIRWRHSPPLHARYMACTALTMVDPILARVMFFHAGIDIPWTQMITYLLVDAILLALWLRDRRAGRDARVFPRMLALFAAFQLPTFFVPQTAAWQSFGTWFGALPLP